MARTTVAADSLLSVGGGLADAMLRPVQMHVHLSYRTLTKGEQWRDCIAAFHLCARWLCVTHLEQ
eukprot:3491327-Amphidinium_carterae.1